MSILTGIAGRIPRSGTTHLRTVNIALIVFLAALGGLAYRATQTTAKPAQATVRTAPATRGVVLSSVSASGTVQSPSDLSVGFQTSGTVSEIDVKQGERVTKGQVVARLEATNAQSGVAQAQASLTSAEAGLAQTKAGETTAQKTADAVSVAQGRASLSQANTQLANANAQLVADKKAAAASLTTAQSLTTLKQNEAQLRADRGNQRAAVATLASDKAKLTVGATTYASADEAVTAFTAIVAQDTSAQQSAQQANYDLQLQQTRDQQQLSAAQTSLSRATSTSDKASWQSTVDSDQAVVNADAVKLQEQAKTLSSLGYQLSQDQSTLQTFQTLQSTLTQDLSSIQSYAAKIVSDRNAVTSATASRASAIQTALSNRSSTVAKDRQSITSARQQVASARLALNATKANNASKATVTFSAIAQAEASVVQARTSLATAQRTLSQTVLRAPASGTVASVGGVVGQSVSATGNSLVSASSSSSTSTASSGGSSGFVQLVKVGGLQVTATFSESDAAKIHVGQPGTVTVSALPNEKLAAHVIAVDTVGTTSSGVVQYSVTLALDRTAANLKPGMSASVTVTTAERDGVLNVPNAAVTGSGSNATVKVMQNGTQQTVSVVAGLKGDSTTEIASGLTAGRQVVISTATTATSTGGSGAAGGFPGGFGGGGLGGGRGFPAGGGPGG